MPMMSWAQRDFMGRFRIVLVREESSSFLKKRTKKLLVLARVPVVPLGLNE
jgi:hypothetical protein